VREDSIGDNNTQEPSGDLSGGQWQRITAGRGFYREADLLIMDEPSSALDPRAEDALFQSIRSRQGTRTTILITHRLANVIHADRIYVLHDGRVEEEGTHTDLVAACGRYTELFTLQASGYTSESTADGGDDRRIAADEPAS
jgi:ATP-binding cassette subfamily B protein